MGQLLGIARRSVTVAFDDSKKRCSRRKLIPVNAKTLGDHLLLKRIEANLSQSEVAAKTGFTARKIQMLEHDRIVPNTAEWQALDGILHSDSAFLKG
jgi:hypothetical protein